MKHGLRWAWILAVLTGACVSTTELVQVWRSPRYVDQEFKKVLVLGILSSPGKRRIFEDAFVEELRRRGVQAVRSYTLLPEDDQIERSRLEEVVVKNGFDAVLSARLLGVRQETEVSPGYVTAVPAVGFSRDFYGYYGAAWYRTTPPAIYQYNVVTVETSLYETKSWELLWSGTTRSVDPGAIDQEISGFTDAIMKGLLEKASGLAEPTAPVTQTSTAS
jgi:hypothetical protein